MWIYKSKEITSIKDIPTIKDPYGFVYIIYCKTNSRFYIGKKNFYSLRKKHFGKKLSAQISDKRLKRYEIVKTESNWLTYWGSVKDHEEYQHDLKLFGPDNFTRTIISICYSSKMLTYKEMHFQVISDILTNPLSYNSNILGKWFKKDFKDD